MAFLESTTSSILDTNTLNFIVDGIKDVIGIFTTPPLGIFLTIGVVGCIAGLAIGITRAVRK